MGSTPLVRIEKPRILLLDCNLEYKKGESKTDAELMKQEDFTKMLQLEVRGESRVDGYRSHSLRLGTLRRTSSSAWWTTLLPSSPTSFSPKRAFPVRWRLHACLNFALTRCPLRADLAQHYLVKYNITGLRRVRKSDNIRIARSVSLPKHTHILKLLALWVALFGSHRALSPQSHGCHYCQPHG